MTDFLSSLVQRSFGAQAAIRPRLAFLFEPAFPHGEPATDTSPLREVESVSGDLVRPAAVRPDEPALDSFPARRSEADDPVALVQEPMPASRPQAVAAPLQPAPARRVMQQGVVDETEPRPRLLARDLRGDEDARIALPQPPSRSTVAVRPRPPEIAEPPKESGHEENRGLLVPSRIGARIAADLQSSVSAANVKPRDRGPGPQRAAESDHASAERNVQVTIGRIEVRATSAAKTPVRERATSSPVMGLDDYLKRQARRGGQ